LSLDAAPSISLFWLATRPDGHFMANQCRARSEALDPFEYTLSTHDDAATGQALADIIIGLANQVECDAARQPGPEALPRNTFERVPDRIVGQTRMTITLGDLAGEHSARRAIAGRTTESGGEHGIPVRAAAPSSRHPSC